MPLEAPFRVSRGEIIKAHKALIAHVNERRTGALGDLEERTLVHEAVSRSRHLPHWDPGIGLIPDFSDSRVRHVQREVNKYFGS